MRTSTVLPSLHLSSHHEAIFRYKCLSVVILGHYYYFIMLRADRNKITATRALAGAALRPRQSKISSKYARTSCAYNQNELACGRAALDVFENQAQITVDNTMGYGHTGNHYKRC